MTVKRAVCTATLVLGLFVGCEYNRKELQLFLCILHFSGLEHNSDTHKEVSFI